MNVFKPAVVASILSMAIAQTSLAGWKYKVELPEAPQLVRTVTLTNPSVSDIQAAIEPGTRIKVIGTVQASNGQTLTIDTHDVWLDFKNAGTVNWSGGDTWDAFLNVTGQRVKITNLDFNVTGSGKCRGMWIYSPASDVTFTDNVLRNISDGIVADGEWERVNIERVQILDAGDWPSGDMDGGYGMYFEDDDWNPDYLRVVDVTVKLSGSSGQHGMRVSQVQNLLIDQSFIGANNKRSFWAYGTDRVVLRNTVFDQGSVMFNLMTYEDYTFRPVKRVRIDNCEINHRTIMTPLQIYCGKSTMNFRMRNTDITSTSADWAAEVSWRENNGGNASSHNICWVNGSNTFNGHEMYDDSDVSISDWSTGEQRDLHIGGID